MDTSKLEQARFKKLQNNEGTSIYSNLSKYDRGRIKKKFILLFVAVLFLGLFIRVAYQFTHELNPPNRKDVQTFTGFRSIDRWMLLWPFLGIIAIWNLPWDGNRRVLDHKSIINFRIKVMQQLIGKWSICLLLFQVFF